MSEREITLGAVVWFILFSLSEMPPCESRPRGKKTHTEFMLLMINSACRLLWIVFLKVKTHPNKDHRARILFLHLQPIAFINLKINSETP